MTQETKLNILYKKIIRDIFNRAFMFHACTKTKKNENIKI